MTCETPLHYLQPQAWLLLGCCEGMQPKFGSLGCWVLALQMCRAPTQGDRGQSLFLEMMRAQLFSNVQIASLTLGSPPVTVTTSHFCRFSPFGGNGGEITSTERRGKREEKDDDVACMISRETGNLGHLQDKSSAEWIHGKSPQRGLYSANISFHAVTVY